MQIGRDINILLVKVLAGAVETVRESISCFILGNNRNVLLTWDS